MAVHDACREGLHTGLCAWCSRGMSEPGAGNVCAWYRERLQHGVLQVECGDLHTIALGSSREVFSWGAGDSGQLGHGVKDDLFSPRCVKGLLVLPRRSMCGRCVKGLLGEKVHQIASGAYHCAAVNSQCSVFTWGAGQYGRLGHGDDMDCTVPRLVEDLERKGIRCLGLGLYHSVAVADNGDMYSWGRGSEGQLGHEDKTKQELRPRPVEVMEGKNVKSVAAGDFHSVALTGESFPLPPTPNTDTKKCAVM